ncbi:MAG: hypothetical protein ACJ74O_13495 [Frankiaceae bacterium]
MSPRRFAGWEPRTVTTYHYDEQGCLLRSVTAVEPEWDAEQQQTALALAEVEADECPGCGEPLSESMAADSDGRYDAESAGRCHACDAIAIAAEAHTNAPRPWLRRWRVKRR